MSDVIFINELVKNKTSAQQRFPDKIAAQAFIENLFQFLFISNHTEAAMQTALEKYKALKQSFISLLLQTLPSETEATRQADSFFAQLPSLYNALLADAEAIFSFDPAANNKAEVIVAYPGFYATVVYRLSHQLWRQGLQLVPRLFSEFAHSKTGIDIHPGAQIGAAFAIDHGTGVVVGETAIIGSGVKLYQGVTLGALNVAKSMASSKRHPTIQNDVVIYAGATILGGDTIIGSGSIIGGNVWLTYSVPSNSVVYHHAEIKIKDKNPFPEPINFII